MELFNSFSKNLPEELSPLIKSLLEECCEAVENSSTKVEQPEFAVYISFKMCIAQLIAVIEAFGDDYDSINLNYRGQSFLLSRSSQHWKQLKAIHSQLADLTF